MRRGPGPRPEISPPASLTPHCRSAGYSEDGGALRGEVIPEHEFATGPVCLDDENEFPPVSTGRPLSSVPAPERTLPSARGGASAPLPGPHHLILPGHPGGQRGLACDGPPRPDQPTHVLGWHIVTQGVSRLPGSETQAAVPLL